jgi:hypothetical protein
MVSALSTVSEVVVRESVANETNCSYGSPLVFLQQRYIYMRAWWCDVQQVSPWRVLGQMTPQ